MLVRFGAKRSPATALSEASFVSNSPISLTLGWSTFAVLNELRYDNNHNDRVRSTNDRFKKLQKNNGPMA